MRCVWRVAVGLWLAVAFESIGLASSRADALARERDTILFFSGTDLWRHGSFSHGGMLWSPGGLERDGFTLKLLLGGGHYRYTSGALGDVDIIGQQAAAFVLPGWRFVRDRMIVTLYAGLDFQYHLLTPFDPGSNVHGTQTGLRGAAEFWYEPDPVTMWAADISVSTIGPSYSARAATGWRVFDSFYAGPEIGAFAGGDDYGQIRAGLHVTGIKTQWAEWTAAFGWTMDNDDRDGMYGRIGLLTRR